MRAYLAYLRQMVAELSLISSRNYREEATLQDCLKTIREIENEG